MATLKIPTNRWRKFESAVHDHTHIAGWTHQFYRYPARFSPNFARAAIEIFSTPGQLVLDPYMGGGTTIIEAMACNRAVVGIDLNSLAVFVTKVKTTPLKPTEELAIQDWAKTVIPMLSYHYNSSAVADIINKQKTRNLHIPRARYLKKVIAVALRLLDQLPTENSRKFVRCAIIQTAQLALDGRKTFTSVEEFRQNLKDNISQMLEALGTFRDKLAEYSYSLRHRYLYECNAAQLDTLYFFKKKNKKVDLLVTSPPYPGVHMLYHRWQVDGRKETPAPYWMANCNDGQGESYYNFGSRQQKKLGDRNGDAASIWDRNGDAASI